MLVERARVRMGHDVDLMPHTILKKGEEGTIVHVEADALGVYSVEIKMDKLHKGLAEWDNAAYLVAPELDALELVRGSLSGFPRLVATVAAVASWLFWRWQGA